MNNINTRVESNINSHYRQYSKKRIRLHGRKL